MGWGDSRSESCCGPSAPILSLPLRRSINLQGVGLPGSAGVTGRGAWGAMLLHTGDWEAKVSEIPPLAICLLEASLRRWGEKGYGEGVISQRLWPLLGFVDCHSCYYCWASDQDVLGASAFYPCAKPMK